MSINQSVVEILPHILFRVATIFDWLWKTNSFVLHWDLPRYNQTRQTKQIKSYLAKQNWTYCGASLGVTTCLESVCRGWWNSNDPFGSLKLSSAGLFCLTYCSWNAMLMQYVRMLSTTHLSKVLRMLVGREACFSFLGKCSLCWSPFVIPEVILLQLRSCKICTPRNLMFSTLSIVRPLMLRGACLAHDLWKLMIIFFCSVNVEHQGVLPAPAL